MAGPDNGRIVARGDAPAAFTADPVLAQQPHRFVYVERRGRQYLRYAAALIGIVAVVTGMTLLSGENFPKPIGIALIVAGVVFIAPTLLSLRQRGKAQWRRREINGAAGQLRSEVFIVNGDEARATEIHKKISSVPDARHWPVFNPGRSKGAIRVGVHTAQGDEPILISVWMPDEDQARCWQLIETRAQHTDSWMRSLQRQVDDSTSVDAMTTQLQNLD